MSYKRADNTPYIAIAEELNGRESYSDQEVIGTQRPSGISLPGDVYLLRKVLGKTE